MEDVPPAQAAGPAPIVLADVARHVRTATVLLDERRATRASADFDSGLLLAPLLKIVDLFALACFTVEWLPALAADSVVALRTNEQAASLFAGEETCSSAGCRLSRDLPKIDNLVAVRCDTKHKVILILRHPLVLLELLVLLEGLRAY